MCKPNYFGFGILVDGGCQKCDCDIYGTDSDDFQCDDFGKCKCREGFAGLKCNKCHENRHNFTSGCPKCEGKKELKYFVQKIFKFFLFNYKIVTILSMIK